MVGGRVGQQLEVIGRVLEPGGRRKENGPVKESPERRAVSATESCTVGRGRLTAHLVVGGHVERHESLQEDLGGLVVTEQGVSVDIVSVGLALRTTTERQPAAAPEGALTWLGPDRVTARVVKLVTAPFSHRTRTVNSSRFHLSCSAVEKDTDHKSEGAGSPI